MNKLFILIYTNQTTSYLVHSWNIFDALTNHGHTQTHKTYHGPYLGKPPLSPLYYSLQSTMGATPKWHFFQDSKLIVLKFPKIGNPTTLELIIFYVDLLLRWGLKKSCILRQELSNDMLHAPYMHVNYRDSKLLVIENQIDTLTLGLLLAITCVVSTQMDNATLFKHLNLKNFPMI